MSRLWAITRHTLAEALRLRVALVFVGILLLLLIGLPFSLRNEDSVSSAVQTFLSLSLGSVGFILSLLTIFLSRSLSDEFVNRQILILMTKPIPRWQFIVGKTLGILIVNFVLLMASGLAIYATTRVLASWTPRDELDAAKLHGEILTARHAVKVKIPDFLNLATRIYDERREKGGYDDVVERLDPPREKERLVRQLEAQWRTLPPADSRVFEFVGVRCERRPDRTLQIRYKPELYNYPPDEVLRCQWFVGNPDKGTATYRLPRRDIMQRYHALSVPTDAVAEDQTLTAALVNVNPFEGEGQFNCFITFTSTDDVEVLFPVGTFGGNLLRQLALMMCKLCLLAAFAITMACVFSFPVACFVSLTFLAMVSLVGFLNDSISFFDDEGLYGAFKSVVTVLYQVAFFVLPDFSKYDGIELLAEGRNITLIWVLTAFGKLVLLGTTALGLVACILFQGREVSEVSV